MMNAKTMKMKEHLNVCPYCDSEADICEASVASLKIGAIARLKRCNSENYETCVLYMSKCYAGGSKWETIKGRGQILASDISSCLHWAAIWSCRVAGIKKWCLLFLSSQRFEHLETYSIRLLHPYFTSCDLKTLDFPRFWRHLPTSTWSLFKLIGTNLSQRTMATTSVVEDLYIIKDIWPGFFPCLIDYTFDAFLFSSCWKTTPSQHCHSNSLFGSCWAAAVTPT